jgi:hypothetical protein
LAINWGAMSSTDERIVGNSWYKAGHLTPLLGKQIFCFYSAWQHLSILTDSSDVHSGKQREEYPTRPATSEANPKSTEEGGENTVGPDELAVPDMKIKDSDPILSQVCFIFESQTEN